jgi:hypothetical protein
MRTTLLRTLAMVAMGFHLADPYMTTADTSTKITITGTADCLKMRDNNFKDNSNCFSSVGAMPYIYVTFSRSTAVASIMVGAADTATFDY